MASHPTPSIHPRIPPLQVRHLGIRPYSDTWAAMARFTDARGPDTADEFWILEHPPIFTLGQAGRFTHVGEPGTIPVVRVDRGGQVTYHGPGQLVLYVLLDLRRLGFGVKALVHQLEAGVIEYLEEVGISGTRRSGAPGVYVDGAKIAALGLRIRHGCSFHGLALNVALDLEPFSRIHPCGIPDLQVTSLEALGIVRDPASVGARLADILAQRLGLHPA